MQKTIKLKTHTTSVGVAHYPYLFSPDTKFDSNGLYRTKLTLPKADAKSIVDEIEGTIKEVASQNEGKLSPHKPYKSLEDGTVEFTFKLKAKVNTKSGTDFEQRPKVFDAKGVPITEKLSVYSGTKMKVAFQCVPYFTNMLGSGCTLRLKAVQILELVEGKGNGENVEESFGFSQEDGFEMKPAVKNVEVSQEESDF